MAGLYLKMLRSLWGTIKRGRGCLTPRQTNRVIFLAELCKTCSSEGFLLQEEIAALRVTKGTDVERKKKKKQHRNGILEENWGPQKKATGQRRLLVSLNYSVEAATGSGCHRCDGVTLETVLPNSCPPSANSGCHGNWCHC